MYLKNITEEVIKLKNELADSKIIEDKKLIIDNLKVLLTNAVKKRANGKIGIAFSGGVDSTLIAFICHNLGLDFTLYNVGVEGAKDLEWAKKISEYYKWEIKQRILDVEEAEEIIKEVVTILPDVNVVKVGVACPELVVFRMAKEDGCDVVLGGLGSEEIYAGYERHLKALDVNEECWKGLLNIFERDLSRDFAVINHIGINVECPFLDKELVKFSMQIKPEYKINKEVKKLVLRETAVELGLKKEFAFRPKVAAQYGSAFDKAIDKLTRKNGFKFKKDYLESLK